MSNEFGNRRTIYRRSQQRHILFRTKQLRFIAYLVLDTRWLIRSGSASSRSFSANRLFFFFGFRKNNVICVIYSEIDLLELETKFKFADRVIFRSLFIFWQTFSACVIEFWMCRLEYKMLHSHLSVMFIRFVVRCSACLLFFFHSFRTWKIIIRSRRTFISNKGTRERSCKRKNSPFNEATETKQNVNKNEITDDVHTNESERVEKKNGKNAVNIWSERNAKFKRIIFRLTLPWKMDYFRMDGNGSTAVVTPMTTNRPSAKSKFWCAKLLFDSVLPTDQPTD